MIPIMREPTGLITVPLRTELPLLLLLLLRLHHVAWGPPPPAPETQEPGMQGPSWLPEDLFS